MYIILQMIAQQGSFQNQSTASNAASTQQHSLQHHPTSQYALLSETPANNKALGVGILLYNFL